MNVGSGCEVTILELARIIARMVGFSGRIDFDPARPNGTRRKLLDSSRIRRLGWAPQVEMESGLRETIQHFVGECAAVPGRID